MELAAGFDVFFLSFVFRIIDFSKILKKSENLNCERLAASRLQSQMVPGGMFTVSNTL